MNESKIIFEIFKKEISLMRKEINFLKKNLEKNEAQLLEFANLLKNIVEKNKSKFRQIKPSSSTQITKTSTQDTHFKPLNIQNLHISKGNEGVSTDRQTNRQTDKKVEFIENNDSMGKVTNILDSLDDIKKEIRLKFRRLTKQEILIFSKIYQLDEKLGFADYKILSEQLKLTESSIRDYVGRLIQKGIPVDKIKMNNKKIHLKISESLKKIATLSAILQLREI